MAEEEQEVAVKEEPSEIRQENSKHRHRSRSPINAPGRRGRGGRGPGRGGRRYGGYRGFDRSADEVDNKTNSEEPHLKRARLFVGNIATDSVTRRDLAQLFNQYGRVLGVSIHGGFAFVQMDRERDANRAIICEDGQQFKGSKIHVEFSQAAKEAGARRAQHHSRSPPPLPRERERDYGPPPPPLPRLDEHRLSHEDRLERLLGMEREMAYLQAREEIYGDMVSRNHLDPPPSMYDHRREDNYRRPPLSPPPSSNPYPSSRDRDYHGDRSDRGGFDDRRPYYSRSEASSMSLHGTGHDSHPEQLLSYPLPRNRTGNSHRGADLLAGAYGGAATSGKSVGYGSSGYGGSSKSPASGGYSLGKSSSSGGGGGWASPRDYPRGGGGSAGSRGGPYSGGGGGGGGGYWS